MCDKTAGDLLERLSSESASAAWTEFLAGYSAVIMFVVRRYTTVDNGASECFIHVCGALSDDGFRRLRSFRADGLARFKTWLMAVVANSCADWQRKQRGRKRPVRSVSRLPLLDQHIYQCIYERHMTREQCLQTLLPTFPALTRATVCEVNARLFAVLTPQQRWRLSSRMHPRPPKDDECPHQVAEAGPGPGEFVADLQEQRRLEAALAQLPPAQRVLLKLRYEHELTLAEVARRTGLPDPFRANRQVQIALKALTELMRAP